MVTLLPFKNLLVIYSWYNSGQGYDYGFLTGDGYEYVCTFHAAVY